MLTIHNRRYALTVHQAHALVTCMVAASQRSERKNLHRTEFVFPARSLRKQVCVYEQAKLPYPRSGAGM